MYQLMGGKFRDKVRIYCDSDMDVPIGPKNPTERSPGSRTQGFTAMKIDLDDAMRSGALRFRELDREAMAKSIAW
jgi:L-alanine-DL-glutamate epimerase-like enolase superfamily enzyme